MANSGGCFAAERRWGRECGTKKTDELLVVHGLDGLLSRGLLGKGNKAKATRATRARLTVDISGYELAGKCVKNFSPVDGQGEEAHVMTIASTI